MAKGVGFVEHLYASNSYVSGDIASHSVIRAELQEMYDSPNLHANRSGKKGKIYRFLLLLGSDTLDSEGRPKMKDSCRAKIYRFFVPDSGDFAAKMVELPDDEAHYARHVLRLRAGQVVELFDGCGSVAMGRIAEISRKAVFVEIDRVEKLDRSQRAIHLAFAVPKGKRLDWLLEKATELGAASLQPVIFERSVAGGEKLSPSKLQRWQGHCIAAAKQCGLNFLPEIREPVSLQMLLDDTGDQPTLLGDCMENAITLTEAFQLPIVNRKSPIRILIGPEGGLTEAERSSAINVESIPVRLGQTTLRTETAAIALLATTTAML